MVESVGEKMRSFEYMEHGICTLNQLIRMFYCLLRCFGDNYALVSVPPSDDIFYSGVQRSLVKTRFKKIDISRAFYLQAIVRIHNEISSQIIDDNAVFFAVMIWIFPPNDAQRLRLHRWKK